MSSVPWKSDAVANLDVVSRPDGKLIIIEFINRRYRIQLMDGSDVLKEQKTITHQHARDIGERFYNE